MYSILKSHRNRWEKSCWMLSPYSPVLADLGYLGKELKKRLEAKGIDFLTPIRKNMKGAAEHNNPAILAIRRTIETRISVLNALFNIEHPLARSLAVCN